MQNPTMPQVLRDMHDPLLNPDHILSEIEKLRTIVSPRHKRFMNYYRNPEAPLIQVMALGSRSSLSARAWWQYQEVGLPARLTGLCMTPEGAVSEDMSQNVQRKEIMVENDIAWRINTLVDFAIGQMPVINSLAPDTGKRAAIDALLQSVIEHNGGLSMLQQMTLLGAIYGTSFIMFCADESLLNRLPAAQNNQVPEGENATPGEDPSVCNSEISDAQFTSPEQWGEALQLKLVDAARVLPLAQGGLSNREAGNLDYVFITDDKPDTQSRLPGTESLRRITNWLKRRIRSAEEDAGESGTLWSRDAWYTFSNGKLTAQGKNVLGFVPMVCYTSQALPGIHDVTGMSEVEPLICLQDELNTRLSDRANRITMQSFKMYLARGMPDFTKMPVGPGQMWSTDNPDASIDTFGGDSSCPSEDAHLADIRHALDKVSGVPPVAAGLVESRIGNLTSALALRLTMTSLLSRTERRRAALSRILSALCRRILEIYDMAGILKTTPEERRIDINWPSALPENLSEKLDEARQKLQLGIPQSVVLRELGYEELEITHGTGEQTDQPAATEIGTASGGGTGENGGDESTRNGGVSAAAEETGGPLNN